MNTTVYTSTVTARGHLAAGLVAGAALGAWVASVTAWEVGALVGVALLLTGLHLGIVRLAVGAGEVRVAMGPWPWPGRRIPASRVVAATATRLSRAQVLGIGLPWRARRSRLTVGAGPALRIDLADGEELLVSTADAGVAAALLSRPAPPMSSAPDLLTEVMTMSENDRNRPWFGPKRVGWGLRPQTWQGWAVLVVVLAAILVATALLHAL